MRLRKGDKVKIISGKDKGREGKIEKIYRKSNKTLILGINTYKRHLKKTKENNQGGIVEISRPIDISKVMLICPKCQKLTRIGFKIENSKKYRYCKKCKKNI